MLHGLHGSCCIILRLIQFFYSQSNKAGTVRLGASPQIQEPLKRSTTPKSRGGKWEISETAHIEMDIRWFKYGSDWLTLNSEWFSKYFRGTCQCWALWMSTKPWLYRGRSCWQSICCGWAPPKCFPVLARKGWWQNEAIELHYKWWKGVSLSPSP